jgi:hypothetical protein
LAQRHCLQIQGLNILATQQQQQHATCHPYICARAIYVRCTYLQSTMQLVNLASESHWTEII